MNGVDVVVAVEAPEAQSGEIARRTMSVYPEICEWDYDGDEVIGATREHEYVWLNACMYGEEYAQELADLLDMPVSVRLNWSHAFDEVGWMTYGATPKHSAERNHDVYAAPRGAVAPTTPSPACVVEGCGRMEETRFTVVVTNASYATDAVSEKLLSGDLYVCYGDTTLIDRDAGTVIGTIEWSREQPDFVIYAAGHAGKSQQARSQS